jgi:hypothetical protein
MNFIIFILMLRYLEHGWGVGEGKIGDGGWSMVTCNLAIQALNLIEIAWNKKSGKNHIYNIKYWHRKILLAPSND